MKRKASKSKGGSRKRARSSLGYQSGRSIYRTPKVEKKAFDLSTGSADFINGALNTFVLNPMVNGAELYQRVGRKVYMKSIHIRGYINNKATAVQDVARIIVYYDSQANAALPALGTLLADSNAGGAASGLSEINLVNRARFKVLKDYQIVLPAVTNTAGVLSNGPVIQDPISNTFNINWFIKLKGLETIYNATNGGTVADISSGSLLLSITSLSQASQWQFTVGTRLRYYD